MKFKVILFAAFIVFGCTEREISMRESSKQCEFSENQTGYTIKCDDRTLSLQKSGAVLRLINGGMTVWSTNSFVKDGEFSGISFLSDTGYVGAEKISLKGRKISEFEFDIIDPAGSNIGILNISHSNEMFWLKIVPLSKNIKRYGFSFLLENGVSHYGIGELTDENDIWRKLYHPTEQHFVLDNGSFERPYLQTDEGTDVISPVLFNSRGGFLFSDSYSYLDLSFNRSNNRIFKIHLIPEFGEEFFELTLFSGKNTKKAYEKWIHSKWQKRPDLPLYSSPPDDLIKRPIWTTWALYKWGIDKGKVLGFADKILSENFPVSYLEIDDRWTKKYGDLDFDEDRFPDAKGMIDYLHQRGIKVSLWVPPFVNQDADTFEDGVKNKAFMAAYNSRYPALVGWWNTANIANAGIIDFFTEQGRSWFGKKIDFLIETYGIDGFKYDAGEAQFLPLKPRLDSGFHPNMYSDYYARWGLAHRGVEMRSGYFAQNLPILFRQFDKASHFGFNNGLASVMTQILAMGIIGYPFVLPDMIGGNEYLNKASEELYIRWVELNSFLPYMQFSIPPSREGYSEKVSGITRKYLALREEIIPEIIRASKEASSTQIPLVRPLFFEFEEDEASYFIEDEFMLGSRYLVAPVITEGANSRNIYFPPAKFRNLYNKDEIIEGPKTIENYPAPLEVIPVFERVE